MNNKSTHIFLIIDCINKVGLRNLSFSEITVYTGIQKKELLQFGKSKSEVVSNVFSEYNNIMLDETKKLKNEANAIDSLLKISALLYKYRVRIDNNIMFELQKYYSSIYDSFMVARNLAEYEILKNNLEKGIKEVLYRRDINVDFTSLFFIDKLSSLIKSSIPEKLNVEFNTFFSYILTNHIRGISNIRGVDHLERRKEYIKNLMNE